MAKLSTQEFIDAIKELTVLELNDLVKACEEEFGVSAAAGVVVAAAGGGEAAAAEEIQQYRLSLPACLLPLQICTEFSQELSRLSWKSQLRWVLPDEGQGLRNQFP